MIQLKDVCKYYQVGDDRVRALDHANLHIYPQEFVSIIGPSGSGKSTFLRSLNLLEQPTSGSIVFEGVDITKKKDAQGKKIDLDKHRRKMGMVFQQYNLIPKLTAEENVELPLIYQKVPKKERTERVKEALERVNMYARAKHLPTELSGGQQQRVSIARAIVTRPKLILADEPTGALDSKTSREIIDIFHELHSQGNTIVLITHDGGIAKQAQRSIHILDGQISEVSL